MTEYVTRKTLIEKIRDPNNSEGWADFAEYYSKYIYVIIRNMNLRHHDAEDLMQQVMVKAWQGLPKFEYQPDKHRFRSWLCTITKNTVRSFLTKKSTKMAQMTDCEQNDLQLYLNGISLPEVDKISEEEWELYFANLAMENVRVKFSDTVFQVFELFSEGRSAREISELLDIPVNTIHVYKKRVVNALYKEIIRLDHELS